MSEINIMYNNLTRIFESKDSEGWIEYSFYTEDVAVPCLIRLHHIEEKSRRWWGKKEIKKVPVVDYGSFKFKISVLDFICFRQHFEEYKTNLSNKALKILKQKL